MRALVVYESLWGNTAAVANAIAQGVGAGTRAVSTAEANTWLQEDVDLLVCGAPVFAFHLSGQRVRDSLRTTPPDAPAPADLSHPSMRDWIAQMPSTSALGAAFDTRVRGPFGTGAPAIAKLLTGRGILTIGKPQGFIVTGKYGPLAPQALDDAQRWGAELVNLATAMRP
jgi:hypothetical protein